MSLYDPQKHFAAITAFYALSFGEYQMRTHTHPRCEIMYVTKGTCTILADDKEFTLSPREFIFLDADIPHRFSVEPDHFCSVLNLEFSFHQEKTLLDLSELKKESTSFQKMCLEKKPYFIGTDTENLGFALKDLISHLKEVLTPELLYMEQQKQISDEDIFQNLSSERFFLIRLLFYRFLLELAVCNQKKAAPAGAAYLKRALTYIDTHLTEDLRIPQIAAYAGINKSYLHALFSQQMHCTITDHINRRRLEQAAFLLINSTLSVTEIAFQTGYNSRQHFSCTFEKYYRISPRAYRQLHAKALETSTEGGQYQLDQSGICFSVFD